MTRPDEVRFDPSVVQRFAIQLYRQATALVARFAILGLVGGATLGAMLARQTGASMGLSELLIPGVIALALGAVYGHSKGFSLKLHAQQALWQLQIERNTRGSVAARGGECSCTGPENPQGLRILPSGDWTPRSYRCRVGSLVWVGLYLRAVR
jgi:hypothetical protein